MGRNTLNRAIKSVLTQTLQPSEILVIAGTPPKISPEYLALVTVVENFHDKSIGWTAAENRNIGVGIAKSDFVAFLDDDDIWFPEKMRVQMDFLAGHSDEVSIASTIYSLNRFLKFKRPRRRLVDNESILNAHYGERRFFPSPYYTQTSGVVIKRELALDTPFNVDLPYCEDIWWLHELQTKGVPVYQHPDKLFEVSGNPLRAAARDSSNKNNEWMRKLREVDPKLESNFLRGISFRNALLRGKVIEAFSYLR
jgi:glycosyltransferase involved in cell wall biosynthesis